MPMPRTCHRLVSKFGCRHCSVVPTVATIAWMKMSTPRWGGTRVVGGRVPEVAGAPKVLAFTVKLSAEQKDKLQRLGGATWLRQTIDEAPEPKMAAAPTNGESPSA